MLSMIFNIQKFSIHDGPGIRTSVFFKGCNLRCAWCSNPESQSTEPEILREPDGDRVCGRTYSVRELMDEILKDRVFYESSGGGVTLTGGEPFLQSEIAEELCSELKRERIHIAAETAGNIDEKIFARLAGIIDFIYIDLKHYDAEKHLKYTGADNKLIIRNILWLRDNHPQFVVRIPVIPGFNDSSEDAYGFAKALSEMGIKQVQLLPFHRLGEKKYEYIGKEYLYKNVKPLSSKQFEDHSKILTKAGVLTK